MCHRGGGSARQPRGTASTRHRQLPVGGGGGCPRTPGRTQGEGEAACRGTGTNWVLWGWGDWEIPSSLGTGVDTCALALAGGHRWGFSALWLVVPPEQGWHPPIFPLFISCDANAAGNALRGLPSPLHWAAPSSTHPFYRRGKLRHRAEGVVALTPPPNPSPHTWLVMSEGMGEGGLE